MIRHRPIATHTAAVETDAELRSKLGANAQARKERAAFGRWRNDTPRNVELRTIAYWPRGAERTLPKDWRADAEAAGLTYIGLPSP